MREEKGKVDKLKQEERIKTVYTIKMEGII